MVEFDHKLDEKNEGYAKRNRKIYREPIVMGRKLGLKSTVWTRRKKHPTRKE